MTHKVFWKIWKYKQLVQIAKQGVISPVLVRHAANANEKFLLTNNRLLLK